MSKSLLFLLILVLLLSPNRAFSQGKKYVVGILPVDDQSTESLTEFLPNGLTMLLYNHMREMPDIEPILLGPGGLYDPDSRDWIQEYGKRAHVDAMLISRLLPTIKVNEHKRRLAFAIEVMNVGSGTVTPKLVNDTVEVQTADLFTTLGTSYMHSNYSSFNTTVAQVADFFRNPSDFEKQRLGLASLKLVDWTNSFLQAQLPTLGIAHGSDGSAATPPCSVVFRIRYMTKHAIAKGYTLLADDTDQSSAIDDGIATFSIAGGPLVIRVQIPDPPYGLPTQKLYQTSTNFSCSAQAQSLTMEIGAAGETLLRWE